MLRLNNFFQSKDCRLFAKLHLLLINFGGKFLPLSPPRLLLLLLLRAARPVLRPIELGAGNAAVGDGLAPEIHCLKTL